MTTASEADINVGADSKISSAYRTTNEPKIDEHDFVVNINRKQKGDKTEPCLTPNSRLNIHDQTFNTGVTTR